MKNRFLILSIACLFSFMLEAASSDPTVFGPYEVGGLEVQARILPSTASLEEEGNGFKDTFLKLYEPYTSEQLYGLEGTAQLGGPDGAKQAAVTQVWNEEEEALGKRGIFHVRLETVEGAFMGYFSVENWDIYETKPDGMPDHSIYVRHFYLLPYYQGKGVLKGVMPFLLPALNPDVQHVYAATRRINKIAKKLYVGLGFQERAESLHGLNPAKYISYELHLGA
jgi:RimJ/RimL family protein N-acetyltransferase